MNNSNINLENLFVFEMANNHQGSVEHGKKIINEMAKIVKEFKINAAIKFQYRQLDSFIHPDFRTNSGVKHIERFLSTELSSKEFKSLIDYSKKHGLITMVTPFDESSVDLILEHGVDIIKVASCSSDDWSLLNKIKQTNKPIIASTGGLDYKGIDDLYSFFKKKPIFALLHCVGIYPTPNEKLNLNAISNFISRYPNNIIGYSGHEDPNNTMPISIAIAKGAKIFERHVGVETDQIKLNAYSMNPSQVRIWVHTALNAIKMLGNDKQYYEDESISLLSLKRGVFAKKKIFKGEEIKPTDVFFAMPCKLNQLDSGTFGKLRATFIASKDYEINEGVFEELNIDKYHTIRAIIHQIQSILRINNIEVGNNISAEISHHYGIENFNQNGLFIINQINKEYCKKLLIMLPGQVHPEQYHIKKQETFHVVLGSLKLTLDGINKNLKKGDIITIERGVKHEFSTDTVCIIEEISSTHYRDDSFYSDEKINMMDPISRKTIIEDFYV